MQEFTKQQIGEAIKSFRRRHGYSQQELADKIGISNIQIMRWENAKTMPSLLAIKALRDLKILPDA